MQFPTLSDILAVAQSRGRNSKAPGLWKGLVGAWPFAGPDTLTAYDVSGYGNYGTLINGPTRVVTEMGRAVEFDGSDDRVVVPFSQSYNTTRITVAGLVEPANVSGYSYFASRWVKNRWVVGRSSGAAYCVAKVDGVTVCTSRKGLTAGKPSLIVFTYDGKQGAIYVDGPDNPGTDVQAGDLATGTENLLIGDGAGKPWAGKIHFCSIWSRALLLPEIQHLANPGTCWDMYTPRALVLPAAAAPTGSLLLRLQTEGLFVGSAT